MFTCESNKKPPAPTTATGGLLYMIAITVLWKDLRLLLKAQLVEMFF